MSRTGGLLELSFAMALKHNNPELTMVNFMHRTASDWVKRNWNSIVSATNQDFCPRLWVVKGHALAGILAKTPPSTSVDDLANPARIFRLASRVGEHHPQRHILVDVLDRLETQKARLAPPTHPIQAYSSLLTRWAAPTKLATHFGCWATIEEANFFSIWRSLPESCGQRYCWRGRVL